jgi:hypothetical protein
LNITTHIPTIRWDIVIRKQWLAIGTFSLVCNLVLELKSWYMIWRDSISSFLSKWVVSKFEICYGYIVGNWKVIASFWNLGWSFVITFQDVSNYFFFPFPFASPFFVGDSFVVGSSYANIGQNQYYIKIK